MKNLIRRIEREVRGFSVKGLIFSLRRAGSPPANSPSSPFRNNKLAYCAAGREGGREGGRMAGSEEKGSMEWNGMDA